MKRWKQGKRIMSILLCASLISTSGITALADNDELQNETGQAANVGAVKGNDLRREETQEKNKADSKKETEDLTEPEAGEITEEPGISADIQTEEPEAAVTEEIPETEDIALTEETDTTAVDQPETQTQTVGNESLDLKSEEALNKEIGSGQYDDIYLKKNWEYIFNKEEDKVILTKYKGADVNVFVPSNVQINNNEYGVIIRKAQFQFDDEEIEDYYAGAFCGNKEIKTVQFDNGVNIEDNDLSYAFYGCTGLTDVSGIPVNTKKMQGAFEKCSSLVQAPVIPDGVTEIDGIFRDCANLKQITTIPAGVTNIDSAFYGCKSLEQTPQLPAGIVSLKDTFRGCTSLTKAPVIPNTVTNLDAAFDGCSSLSEAPVIPDHVVSMVATFSGCVKLVKAPVIPSSVVYLNNTFSQCTSLVEILEIKNGVVDMQYAFEGCTSLIKAPVLPDSVIYLQNAFKGCTNLVQAPAIPDGVIDMRSTFEDCSKLQGEMVLSGNPRDYYNNEGKLIHGNQNCFLNAATGGSGLIVNYTADCKNIDQIIATRGAGNNKVTKGKLVTVPSTGRYQLYFDANGGTVNPDRKSVKTGDKYGELPTPVKTGYHFAGWSTDKIGSQIVTSETVYSLKEDQRLFAVWRYENFSSKWNYDVNEKTKTITVRKYIGSDATVVVPDKIKLSNTDYAIVVGKTGDRAKNGVFSKNRLIASIQFESGVKYEDNNMQYAFAECSGLKTVSGIPDSVVNLKGVFQDCTSLEKFYDLPQNKNIKDISSAFTRCTALKEVENLPQGATDLSQIFSGCINLLEIPELPLKAENISGAFEDCRSITKAPSIPSSVKDLRFAFSGCSNLTKAPSIPKKIKDLSGYLKGCEKITNAPSIPSGVTNMEATFSGCVSITKAPKIPSGVTNLEETFRGCKKLKNAPVLPEKIKNLYYTFEGCSSLEDAPKIPATVRNLSNTFSGCESLKKAPAIPKGVTSLHETFYNCKSLTKTPSIPNGVKEMYSTFQGCSSLKTATEIPDSVTSMRYTFSGCSKLTQVYAISNNVQDMMGTFTYCTSLRQAPDIPKSVNNMINTFKECVNLQGKMIINADLRKPIFEDGAYGGDDEIDGLEAYFQTFYNAGINGSGLTLDYGKNCKNISKIVASKGSGNNKVKKGKKVTIPSKMNYEVKFNGNGGKSGKASKTIKYGSFYGTLPSAKRAGYEFKGWYTKKKGGSKITSDKKIKSAKNRTVYAQWTKVKVKKVSGISLSSTTKTRMVVSTKEVKGAKGYQILYAANSSFTKGKKSLNTGLLNKTVKKLKSGRKYYVKVRAYKADSTGKRIYGSYSKAAAVKVK